jgi:hypothetical protein
MARPNESEASIVGVSEEPLTGAALATANLIISGLSGNDPAKCLEFKKMLQHSPDDGGAVLEILEYAFAQLTALGLLGSGEVIDGVSGDFSDRVLDTVNDGPIDLGRFVNIQSELYGLEGSIVKANAELLDPKRGGLRTRLRPEVIEGLERHPLTSHHGLLFTLLVEQLYFLIGKKTDKPVDIKVTYNDDVIVERSTSGIVEDENQIFADFYNAVLGRSFPFREDDVVHLHASRGGKKKKRGLALVDNRKTLGVHMDRLSILLVGLRNSDATTYPGYLNCLEKMLYMLWQVVNDDSVDF